MNRLFSLHQQLVTLGPRGRAQRLFFSILCAAGWLYGVIGSVRRAIYRLGIPPVFQAPVPVVSVGNLAVGGTGKTPMVDHLLKWCIARHRRVAVVSRGYGGRGAGRVGVVCAGQGPLLTADVCGDEPYLLAKRNPEAVVLVAPRRSEGIRAAIDRFDADLILLDDGFQHLAVARDLDIVLLDARRPLGNGRLLPAGVLRESPAALNDAGLIVLTRSDGTEDPDLSTSRPLIRCRHRLSSTALALTGETVPLQSLVGKRCVAFAGIADPDNFFTSLGGAGLHLLRTLPLPDHVVYDDETLGVLVAAIEDADFLVTTEKDGVKIAAVRLPLPCYQIPVTLEFHDEGSLLLERAFEAIIQQEKS